jgi:hypothetical protein
MRRASLLGLLISAFISIANRTDARGVFLGPSSVVPLEQRVAVAAGDRTSTWISLRFTGPPADVAMVLIVTSGMWIDESSDAWFEALELATARRVVPRGGGTCSDSTGNDALFEDTTRDQHITGLAPAEVVRLADILAVSTWAEEHGLPFSPADESALGTHSYIALRYSASGGEATTRTLRIVEPPGADVGTAAIPHQLMRANGADLVLTTWAFGPRQAGTTSTRSVDFDLYEQVEWDPLSERSNYLELRSRLLAEASNGGTGVLTEGSSHAVIVDDIPVVDGVTIPPVVATYFERAVAYDGLAEDAPSCEARARAALVAGGMVATSCARGALDSPGSCTEMPATGEVDPRELRCGEFADDLAIALSGLEGNRAQLTRFAQVALDGQTGRDGSVRFTQDRQDSPVLEVSGETSACPSTAIEGGNSGCDCGNSFTYCTVTPHGSLSDSGRQAYSLSLLAVLSVWFRRRLRKRTATRTIRSRTSRATSSLFANVVLAISFAWLVVACSKNGTSPSPDGSDAGTTDASACIRSGTACSFNGGPLDSGSDCCSGVCVNNRCACSAPGLPCHQIPGGNNECCTGLCAEDVCSCGGAGVRCTGDRDCCDGSCLGGRCARDPEGTPCTTSDSCISNSCGFDGCECRIERGPMGGECCSDVGGDCATDGGVPRCCALGATCDDGECSCVADGLDCWVGEDCCNGRICADRRCCLAPGAACTNSDICCDGPCDATGTCPDVPECLRTNQPCSSSSSCCSGSCSFDVVLQDTVCG